MIGVNQLITVNGQLNEGCFSRNVPVMKEPIYKGYRGISFTIYVCLEEFINLLVCSLKVHWCIIRPTVIE